MINGRPNAKSSLPRLLAVAGRLLLLPVVVVLLGYLWLSVAGRAESPAWIGQLVLVSPVAFTAYWLLGWSSQAYHLPRRMLLGITVLLMLPALTVVLAVEPWQRAEMQRQHALYANQTHLDTALERHDCPNGDTLVVAPWLFVIEGKELRRLVELRLVPTDRTSSSPLLVRATARGDLAHRQTTAEEQEAAVACIGNAGALEGLVQRIAEGTFE
ncbi:hypothetical protein [Thioalkalivibrio sp.]|uniref:hypothetical protein n=1 Tax=Thioalkalivibrio sp. TaxID=2093813 RepID=UPI003564369F